MKTIKLVNRSAWAAAALFVATTVLTGLTACAEKDVPAVTPDKQIAQDLVGIWQGKNFIEEAIVLNGIKHRLVMAVQVMDFNDDGTGTYFKLGCNAAGEPITLSGGAKKGQKGHFHYTVGKDSVITIILHDSDGDTSTPKTWQLRFGTDGLNGTDGGNPYTLQKADADWQAYVTHQEKKFLKNYSSIFTADATVPSFLNDWQHCDTVYVEGLPVAQYTPWSGFVYCDIGDAIRFDVQKEAGWEMAFCQLNDKNSKNCRMFGLYNRYTGILRVFNYVLEPGGQHYGNEMGFKFMTDDQSDLPRYPFYNSMEYAIPVCHDYNDKNTFNKTVTLYTDMTPYKPFEVMVSAYTTHTNATGVTTGWHCTDFNFSGYTESGINWAGPNADEDRRTLLNITPYSSDQQSILLTGTILGNLSGSFTDPEIQKEITGTTLSTITQILGTVSSGYSGIFGMLNQSYGMVSNADKLRNDYGPILSSNAIGRLFIGGVALNGAATVMNIINQFAGKPTEKVTVTPGKIDMTINAKIDLTGTVSGWNSINDAGARITPQLVDATQARKEGADSMWIGSGCFGIAEDPVIYVSKEDLLSVSNNINITRNGDHYEAPSFPNDSVRLVSFLDPRTIKVCLNTDVYHDIDSVHMMINYGVNTNRPVGNSDTYRRMLMLDERPTFSIMPTQGGNQLSILTTPTLHVMKNDAVIRNDFYTENAPDSVSLALQPMAVQNQKDSIGYVPFYGRVERFADKCIVMDPQVFIPYELKQQDKETSAVYDVVIPDFVVTVTVAFKCREVPDGVFFSQAYIPKIELIGHSDLATFYNELKKYSDICAKNGPVGTLVNNTEINVYNSSGEIMLTKTLNILNKCK